jgi:hypothetical protein
MAEVCNRRLIMIAPPKRQTRFQCASIQTGQNRFLDWVIATLGDISVSNSVSVGPSDRGYSNPDGVSIQPAVVQDRYVWMQSSCDFAL